MDYQLQKELSEDYPASLAMATGENLFSMQDARNLIRYGGMVRNPKRANITLQARPPFVKDRVPMCGFRVANAVAADCMQHPGTDILQFDPALSYGLVEYLRTIDMLETNGWSRTDCVPHGGHLFALHIAAGLGLGGNEAYPGVFQPFGGFVDGVTPEDGYVRLVSQEKSR